MHLVECSPSLQKLQYQNLKCKEGDEADGDPGTKCMSMLTGSPVSWHATLDQVPTGGKDFLLYDSSLYCMMVREEKYFL